MPFFAAAASHERASLTTDGRPISRRAAVTMVGSFERSIERSIDRSMMMCRLSAAELG